MAWAALLALAWLAEPATSSETTEPVVEAPSSASTEPESIDPWASVPLQTAVPTPATPATPTTKAAPRDRSPLLDPWASGVRVRIPPLPDPELRDPFGTARAHQGPHVARAELRDPFARRGAEDSSARPTPASRREAGPSSTPTLPLHPELRDPFHRPARARPTPPPDPTTGPTQGDPPRPPTAPPVIVPPVEPSPRSTAV